MGKIWRGEVAIYRRFGRRREKILVEAYPDLQVDVLKVAHHGSNTSSIEPFERHTASCSDYICW